MSFPISLDGMFKRNREEMKGVGEIVDALTEREREAHSEPH